MDTVTAIQPELIRPPANTTRYWRIDSVHGKGKHQTHRYLCTVASRSQTNPVRLARSCGFTGPIHCVEMTLEEKNTPPTCGASSDRRTNVKTPDWTRKPSPYGKGTCGATHTHISGHRVIHCGHPTALWPYYIVTPAGETILAPNGRGFKYLADAKAEAERRANATTKENTP